jgi:Mg-chelatase subunit ChlD
MASSLTLHRINVGAAEGRIFRYGGRIQQSSLTNGCRGACECRAAVARSISRYMTRTAQRQKNLNAKHAARRSWAWIVVTIDASSFASMHDRIIER